MVQRHSAELEIDSVVDQGSTFRLIFPAAAPDALADTRVTPSTPLAQPLRILLVDDDPVLIKSLQDILSGDDHDVTIAAGGQAGIDAFSKAHGAGRPFSIVITDLGMPHVDGRRVAAAVKACAPATPVILLTGWGQRLLAENDIPAHVNRVLSKPPKLSDLRVALAQLTEDVRASTQSGPHAKVVA
jgi:CheY-like chemotaxis protein